MIFNENTYSTSFCTIGIDPASTGSDKFAMSCLVYFNNGNIVLVDLDSTPSAYALKHWQSILRDLVKKYGITIKNNQTSHSKYNRARPTAKT